jgi:ribose transport system substrate-binding protein
VSHTFKRTALAIVAGAATLALAACSGSSDSSTTSSAPASSQSSSASADSATVAVDVGTSTPVQLPKGKLKVGIFMNALANAWTKQISDNAQKQAQSYGWDVTVLDAGFNPTTQLNQMQDAATKKTYDAWVVVPIDGSAECKMMSETAPAANIVVITVGTVICGRDGKSGQENWQPGTYAFAGVGETIDYQRAWYAALAKQYTGDTTFAVAVGPDGNGFAEVSKQAAQEFATANPNFKFIGYIRNDYTAPTTFTAAQAFLQAHKDIGLVLSTYSPDMSQGVVKALESLQLAGKTQMSDIGGAQFDVEQIKKGTIQLTMPYYPATQGKQSVEAIMDAQNAATPKRIYDENPGGVAAAPVITKANIDSYTPQF